MTPKNIMSAYKAISELSNCAFPYKITRQIRILRNRLSEEFEAVLDAEKTLVKKYEGELGPESSYKFKSSEAAAQFYTEYQKMIVEECDINLPCVDISKYVDSITISTAAIDALDGLVIFEEV